MLPGLLDSGLTLLLVVFWVGMSLLWTPVLAAESVRRLLDDWPTSSLPVNYPLWMAVVTGVHFALVVVALLFATRGPNVNLVEFSKLTIGLTVGYVTVVWAGVSFGLPRLNRWDPTGDGVDGRVVLAAGAVWYLVCTAFVTLLLAFVAFVFAFPG